MTKLSEDNRVSEQSDKLTSQEISNWLVSYISDLLEIEPEEIDLQNTFARYGLDSSSAVMLTGDLQDWLGKDIEPTIMYDYPTIADLAEHLAQVN
ncbi:acyl carrier protein [Anabaena sp. PCC 7108]|uniref:acyl carrier protein n=1 Tax=Anabaena sp. PCC 7108 TaxID=163908 RepID=UPI0003449CAE|nr:acyl carrier protein [Anabaena sp. PCC 7108]